VDTFDNQMDGQITCDEALYVDTLIVNAGAVLDTGNCSVYYNNLVNNGTILLLGTGVVNVPSGDFNDDGMVDLDDYAFFSTCLEAATPAQLCLDRFDADHDFDLDLVDFANLQRRFDIP